MQKWVFFVLVISMGCGGSLSDEQRKKLREGMNQQHIVKLNDSEIVTASLDQGRAVFAALEKVRFDSEKVDSIAALFKVRLRLLVPGSPDALEVENQVIEAYVIGAESGATQDNIQKLRIASGEDYDSLLYSRPIITSMPDGAINVEGVWNIYMAKREVILSASH